MLKIAIIGAGLAGLTAAHSLKGHAQVTLFEKSRGVSGRMSTRRASPFAFDHGAQFFTAKSRVFQNFIDPLLEQGLVQRWDARFAKIQGHSVTDIEQWDEQDPHYVACPGMNALAKHLAAGLDIQLNTRVAQLRPANQWRLLDDHGHHLGSFDWVIVSTPAPQALELLPATFSHYKTVAEAHIKGCFALMLGFDVPLALEFDAAKVTDSAIGWMAVDSTKPGRNSHYSLLVHSSNEWADQHIEDDLDDVLRHLTTETRNILGSDVDNAIHQDLHRWRYANADKSTAQMPLVDKDQQLALCGDWCYQGKVEAAYTSGLEVAQQLLARLQE